MCRIGIKSNGKKQYTQVPNRFIDRYMSDANGSYLKVYFFLLRFLSEDRDFSMSALADRMDYAEKDILRALRYWEKKGILEFTQDREGNLLSLDLHDLTEEEPLPEAASAPVYKMPESAAALSVEDPEESFLEKVEKRLGRPLGSKVELDLITFLREELQFPEDLILHLYQYAVEQTGSNYGKGLNRYIETVAINWNRQGITCLSDLQKQSAPYEEAAALYRRIFSLHEPLNESQRAYLRKWTEDWQLPSAILEEAFRRASLKPTSDCRYLDAILKKWHESQVRTLEDVHRLDQAHEERKQSLENTQKADMINGRRKTAAPNQFHDFDQREYTQEDWAEIERIMLRN